MAEYNNIEIPEDADKYLFAEDLVRNVMLLNGSVPNFTFTAGPYRELIYNGFNETTEMAVRFLYSSMANRYCLVFQYMQNRNVVTQEKFMNIADNIIPRLFPAGILTNTFLLFCFHMANLAANFYTNGVLNAPDLAILYIVKPILNIDMTAGGWDSLNSSAHRYATMARNSTNNLSLER